MQEPVPLEYRRDSTQRPRPRTSVWGWIGLGFFVLLALSAVSPDLPLFHAHDRESANRAKCSNNLRQIGLALAMYYSESGQPYPAQVGCLIPAEGLSAEVFTCPSSADTKIQGTPAEQAAGLMSGNHCSFVYVGEGMTPAAGATEVVAFDLPDNHTRAGGNVLYGDCHVEWQRFNDLVQLVPELEAGRRTPAIKKLTDSQAKQLYERKWAPQLKSLADGTWAAGLRRPASQPTTLPE